MASSYLVVCLLNAFLSYTATMLNIVTIHAIRKTPSLSKNLKTVLLSLAVSDLGIGLVAQPLYVANLTMASKLNIETSKTYIAIYIPNLILANLFIFATLFLVIVLCAEIFIAIHYYLRYQELVTHKRVVAVVVSTWVLSGLFSLTRLWIAKSIMNVVFGITQLACIITATFFSIRICLSVRLHVNQIQVLQLQQASQTGKMANITMLRKLAMMSVYVSLVLTVCYLPSISTLFIIAFTSRPSTGIQHLQLYALTLEFLNSLLNPVIYCWKMKHIRHTIIGFIRNALTKQN